MIEDIRNQILQSIDVKVKAAELCAGAIEQGTNLMIEALKAGHTIYLCGNGGSAADCQHVACELVGRFRLDRPALPAVALTTDTSILTAVANDFDYGEVFARQVAGLVRAGDVLLALSTSGNATSVLKAAALARQRKAKVIGFTGDTGGQLKQLADCLVAVPSDETPRIQESHITILHIMCGLIEKALFKA